MTLRILKAAIINKVTTTTCLTCPYQKGNYIQVHIRLRICNSIFYGWYAFKLQVHIHYWHAQSYKSYKSFRVEIDHEDTAVLFLSSYYNHEISCIFLFIFRYLALSCISFLYRSRSQSNCDCQRLWTFLIRRQSPRRNLGRLRRCCVLRKGCGKYGGILFCRFSIF